MKIGLQEVEKDVAALKEQIERRDTYVETVRLRSQFDVETKVIKTQISGLWEMCNKLRDLVNGSKDK